MHRLFFFVGARTRKNTVVHQAKLMIVDRHKRFETVQQELHISDINIYMTML